MEKLKELASLCKAGIEISINDHKSYYESVEQYVNEEERDDIEEDVFNEMINRDTVVKIKTYAESPVSFFVVYHYDIDMAIDIMLDDVVNYL